MTDLEELLTRTLKDERRALPLPPGAVPAVARVSRRLQLQRRLALGAAAVVSVALIAGGTMFADGCPARDGKAPSYERSASAQPRTS